MMYYMHVNGQQVGPFDENQLVANGLTAATPVWCEGMANWAPASQVPALAYLFSCNQPPVYGQPQPQYAYQQPVVGGKDKTVAILLAFFLGGFGVHYFYLGKATAGIVLLLTTIFTCGIVGGVWAFINFIGLIVADDQHFQNYWVNPAEKWPMW